MYYLQPVPNSLGGIIATFPFYERPGHVGFGSYGRPYKPFGGYVDAGTTVCECQLLVYPVPIACIPTD